MAELVEKTDLSEAAIQNYRIVGAFPTIKWGIAWVVPNASVHEFIRQAACGELPNIWETIRKACTCETVPEGVKTHTLSEIAEQQNVAFSTVLKRIGSGQIEAYWCHDRWWIPEFVGNKQRTLRKQQPAVLYVNRRFVADQALRAYFIDHEDVEFLDCRVFTPEGLEEQLGKLKADDFFFGSNTQMRNGAHPLDLQSTCVNVRFTQI